MYTYNPILRAVRQEDSGVCYPQPCFTQWRDLCYKNKVESIQQDTQGLPLAVARMGSTTPHATRT